MIKLWFSRFDSAGLKAGLVPLVAAALLIVVSPAARMVARQSPASASLLDQAASAEAEFKFDVAADRLYQIVVEQPRSPDAWTARARLARLLALSGDLSAALLECQALRSELPPDHPLGQPVLGLATTLARRLRVTVTPMYFGNMSARLLQGLASTDEPSHIDVSAAGNIVMADAGQGRAYVVGSDSVSTVPSGADLTTAVLLADGRVLTADKAGISIAGARAAWLTGTWAGKTRQLKKTRSLSVTSNGDLLVIDRDYDGLLRCKAEGPCVPWGPPGKLRVVATGASDFVFILDDKPQIVRVLDNTGRVVVVIGPVFGGVKFGEIADIAVDRAYGLYVLDKQTRRIEILTVRADRTNGVSVVQTGWAMVPAEGPSALKNPTAIGVMPDGAVLVAPAEVRVRIASAAFAVLLLAVSVFAQQTDPVDALRARVDALAQQMDADLPGAAEVLDHLAVDSIEARRSRVLTPAERDVHVKLFLLRGRAHLQLLSNEKAEESFRELLRIAPLFTGELSPLEQQLVDGLRQKEGGVLEVTSTVRGAHVFIDGLEVGVTGDAPVRASLIAGTYEVRLEKPRFKTAAARATVTAGQTITVSDVTPIQNIPPIALLSDRDGVDVIADSVSAGRMVKLSALRTQVSTEESAAIDRFVAMAKLDPETAAGIMIRQPPLDRPITVRFHRECFVDDTRTVVLTSDLLDKLDPLETVAWLGDSAVLRLVPDVGTVRIASTPSDADVFLDGQLVGRTPFERDVCAGPHRVRVRHRIGSYNIAATVTRGRTEAIDVPLKPDLAFLGAVDDGGRAVPEITALVDRALATGLTSYHLASRQDLPPEVRPWTDGLTAELVAAADKHDRDAIARLQKQADANYDAPLLLCAVRRPGAAGIELLLFWNEHPNVDRLLAAG